MIENIYSTIDIKVQSILFELNKEIKQAKGIQAIPRSPYSKLEQEQRPSLYNIPDDLKGEMRQKIETSSDKIGRLLTLKSKVSIDNFELIHSLLSNNYYLEFSPQELNLIVEGRGMRQSA